MDGEWQAPKAAWSSADAVTTADLDRIDRVNPQFLRDNMGKGMGYPRTVAYDAGTDTLTVTFDPVRVRFGATLVEKAAAFSHPITPVAINTTYYVFLDSAGVTSHNTTGVIPAGAIPVCRVAVGATKTTLTLTDLRGTIDATGKTAQDNLDTHIGAADPHPQYATDSDLTTHKTAAVLDHPDGSVTTAKLANGAVTAAKVAADVATQAELDAHAGVAAAGVHGSATAATPGSLAHRDANGDLSARRFLSSAAQGTAPLNVTSTTLVPNLNADMLDGVHASGFISPYGDGSDDAFNSVGNVTFAVGADDSGPVVKQYTSFTLNAGHIMTVDRRCKGLIILCQGDVVINGKISMDNLAARITRGSDAMGTPWSTIAKISYVSALSRLLVSELLPAGGAGGAGGQGGGGAGGAGGPGSSNAAFGGSSGGGGGGGAGISSYGGGGGGGGAGGYGTGGTGGATTPTSGTDGTNGGGGGGGGGGTSSGGGGGKGSTPPVGSGTGSGGGAGGAGTAANGANGSPGGPGGGGIIVIIAGGSITINSGGVVTASSTGAGGAGGNGGAGATTSCGGGGGGGAGGGVVALLARTAYTNGGSVLVNGSAGGAGGLTGSGGYSSGGPGVAGQAGSIFAGVM